MMRQQFDQGAFFPGRRLAGGDARAQYQNTLLLSEGVKEIVPKRLFVHFSSKAQRPFFYKNKGQSLCN